MARNLDTKCKLCRREGRKLFLKAYRCSTPKCPIEKKGAVVPGMHGQKRKGKISDFGRQMREKQKVRRIYWISERQLRKYFTDTKKKIFSLRKTKNTQIGGAGENLLRCLETRLDSVIFRAGFAPSRLVARQLVNHGQIQVNGKKLNIPSFQLKKDQVVTISSKGLEIPSLKSFLEKKIIPPKWLEKKGAAVRMIRLPERKEMDIDIDEQLIIEFYSK